MGKNRLEAFSDGVIAVIGLGSKCLSKRRQSEMAVLTNNDYDARH